MSHRHIWKYGKKLYPYGEEHICDHCLTRRVTTQVWGEGEAGGIHGELIGHVYEYFECWEGRNPYRKAAIISRLVLLPEWRNNSAARTYVNSLKRSE